MRIVKTVADMKNIRLSLPEPVGFVPTMGYFHQGHLSLVRRAKSENASVVVSIFVNPTQFGFNEDLASYPRDEARDLAMLSEESADIVFMPEAAEMYTPGYDSWVLVEKLTQPLEGVARPGHFKGVATVCNKLFNIVNPAKAYFGQKDAQQTLVIRKMVADFNMNLDIQVLPTVREPDGLAMSSRNTYLKPDERRAAAILYQSLLLAQTLWSKGNNDAPEISHQIAALIKTEPLASVDYISINDAETLEELTLMRTPILVSLAVRIGKTRLIDNIILD
jgi:pantoate--beta-alanine ligase